MYAHLTQNFEAFADHVRKVVKNLGEIAAGFALQHNRGDEEFDIDERDTVGEIDQGIAYRESEFLFFVKLAKFAGDRFGNFVGDHF